MIQKLTINGIEIQGFDVDPEVGPSQAPPEGYIVPSFPSYGTLIAKFDNIGMSDGYGTVEINGEEFKFYTPYEFDLSAIAEEFNKEHSDDLPKIWETIEGIGKSVSRMHIYFPGFEIKIGDEVFIIDACEWWVDLFQTTTLEGLCNMTYYTANGEVYVYYAALEGEEDFEIEVDEDTSEEYETVVARDNDGAVFNFSTSAGTRLVTFDVQSN